MKLKPALGTIYTTWPGNRSGLFCSSSGHKGCTAPESVWNTFTYIKCCSVKGGII